MPRSSAESGCRRLAQPAFVPVCPPLTSSLFPELAINTKRSTSRAISSYWERTHWPLQSLYFLLPLLILYEAGAYYAVNWAGQPLPGLVAERMLGSFFETLGATGYYLPGLAVVVLLLCWHLVRRDPWEPEPRLYGLMAVESVVLAVPLFVFMLVLFREPAAAQATQAAPPAAGGLNPWLRGLVLSVGAGIYEETVFRLIGIALLHFVLVDVLALPDHVGALGAVGITAVAFALSHFSQPNPLAWSEFSADFSLGRFLFYVVAGVYFAAVYVLRGFGVVVAVHAVYDVLTETTNHLNGV